MEYKQFVIAAVEREPGKWRGKIRRANGKPLIAVGRRKLDEFITGLDAPRAAAAMSMAIAAIDAGSFSREKVHIERHWRCMHRRSAKVQVAVVPRKARHRRRRQPGKRQASDDDDDQQREQHDGSPLKAVEPDRSEPR